MSNEEYAESASRAFDIRSTSTDPTAIQGQTPLQEMLSILPAKTADALMVCAVPHWFDQEIFAWINREGDDSQRFENEIVSRAIVLRDAQVVGRYRLHDLDRQDILDYLKGTTPEQFRAYHARAADYFRWRLGEAVTPPAGIVDRRPALPADHFEEDIWQREAMYHLLAADEPAGLARFQRLFRAAKQHYQIAVCHRLLGLASEQEKILSDESRRILKTYRGSLVFVGRQRELEAFRQLVTNKENGAWIAYLVGHGGLGKSKLLEEMWQTYCQMCFPDLPDLPIRLIDLYEMNCRRVTGVQHRIAQLLGEAHFQRYIDAFAEYARLRSGTLPDSVAGWEHLSVKHEDMHKAFIADLRLLPQSQPTVLMFDSVEASRDTDVWHWLLHSFLPAIRDLNLVLVLASRPGGLDFGDLQGRVTQLEVKELALEDTLQYFIERGLGQHRSLVDRVHEKTGGHPILVALTCDLLEKKGLPLENLLAAKEKDFALVLTNAFLQIDACENRLVSLMALARYRFNAGMLIFLEKMDPQQAEATIDGISDYVSFTKFRPDTYTCVLHDVIRDAVLQLRWTKEDQRRLANQRIIAYYESQIEQLRIGGRRDGRVAIESDIQLLEAEKLFYELDVDLEQGLDSFRKRFLEAMKSYQLGFGELLRLAAAEYLVVAFSEDIFLKFGRLLTETVEDYRKTFLPDRRLDEIDFMSAELVFEQGHYDLADRLVQEILARSNLTAWVESSSWLMRARVAQQQGDFLSAESYCRRSLWLTEGKEEFDRLTAPVFDILGYVHRAHGEWEKAVWYYRRNMQIRERIEDQRGLANTQNNLAYVYLLQGQPQDALKLAESALTIREKLVAEGTGNRFELGLSYNTRGMIQWDLGHRTEADVDFKRAEVLFEEIGSQRGQALVYLNYGLRERHLRHFEQAVDYFQRSAAIFRERGDKANLAEVLNEEGMSYLDFGHWQEAESAFLQALNLAEDTHNHFKIADVLSNMSQLYLFTGELDKIDGCVRRFEKADGYRFHYPSAQLFIILARAALQQRQIGRYLWYDLLSGIRLFRYAGLRWDVYVSWSRDWQRWRNRMRRLHKQSGEATSVDMTEGARK